MKTRTNAILVVFALLAYFTGLRTANAFYDPGTQRWLNRDPLREGGFEDIRNVFPLEMRAFLQSSEFYQGANLYYFIKNNTINSYDVWGLEEGGVPQPTDPHPPSHPFDPSCRDDREDLSDCFTQAQAFDNAVFKHTGDYISSTEFMDIVEKCMRNKGHIYPPPHKH